MRDSREREKELLPPFDNVVPTFFKSNFETLTKFIKKLLISTIPKINDSMK